MALASAPLSKDDIRLISYSTIVVNGPDYPDVFNEHPDSAVDWTKIGSHTFTGIRGLKYVWGTFNGIQYGFSIPEGGNPPPVTQIINVISKEPGDRNRSASGVRLDIRLGYVYRDSLGSVRFVSWEFNNVDPVEADVIDFTVAARRDDRVPLSIDFYVKSAV